MNAKEFLRSLPQDPNTVSGRIENLKASFSLWKQTRPYLDIQRIHQFCDNIDVYLFVNEMPYGAHLFVSNSADMGDIVFSLMTLGLWEMYLEYPSIDSFPPFNSVLTKVSRNLTTVVDQTTLEQPERQCTMCLVPDDSKRRKEKCVK